MPGFSIFYTHVIKSKINSQEVESDYFTNKVAPNTPTNLEVIAVSFDYVILKWTDNSDNELNFIIERHDEGEEFSRLDTVDANETTYLDYRVEPNTTYYYHVFAVNSDGESEFSNEVIVTTLNQPHTPPQKPINVSGYFNENNANILSWTDNSENEISFHIYRGTDINNMYLIDTVRAGITLYADYDIAAKKIYYYYLTAWNVYGESAPSDTIQIEVTDITVLNTPTLSVTGTTYNSISLKWNSINGDQNKYSLTRYKSEEDMFETDLQSATHYQDTGLIPSTGYHYYLKVTDSYGNRTFSNTIMAFTLPAYSQSRIPDSLIAFYIFSQVINDSVLDQSWYRKPTNLYFDDTSAIYESTIDYVKLEDENLISSSFESTLKISEACMRSNEITIECWLKTSQVEILGSPAQIISFENDSGIAFSLSCVVESNMYDKVKYYANLTTNTTDQYGNPDFSTKDAVSTGVLQHIVFTQDNQGAENFYINGMKLAEEYRPPKFDSWLPPYKLVIANNLIGEEPWLGDLYMIAIYNKALNENEVSTNYFTSPFITDSVTLNSNNYDILVSPNPASEFIQLQIKNKPGNFEITEEYKVRVIDALGLVKIEKVVSNFLNGSIITLNISQLRNGVYTIILFNKHQIVDSKKIVIIR